LTNPYQRIRLYYYHYVMVIHCSIVLLRITSCILQHYEYLNRIIIRANLIGWWKPSAVTENRSKSGQSIYVPKLILKKTIRTYAEMLSQYKSVVVNRRDLRSDTKRKIQD